jgi:hypothetical protein
MRVKTIYPFFLRKELVSSLRILRVSTKGDRVFVLALRLGTYERRVELIRA